jgi:hypothetical protein
MRAAYRGQVPVHHALNRRAAPAYYQGHPATLRITALRPRHRAAASRYLMEALGGRSLARDPEAAEWVSLRADKGQRASRGPARTPGPWV